MKNDNTKSGFYYSVALHFTVALACVMFAYIGIIFAKKTEINEEPFELVEPPAPPPSNPDNALPSQTYDELPPIDLQEVEPLKPLPEPEPLPLPPKPEPKPKPKPKQEKPKKQERVSLQDFRKTNPEKPVKPRTSTTPRQISAPKIKASTSNLDKVKIASSYSIEGVVGTNTAMIDARNAYISYINQSAKQNWVQPDNFGGLRAVLTFTVTKEGLIRNVKVASSSGDSGFDASAVKALSTLSLNPPPDKVSYHVRLEFVMD